MERIQNAVHNVVTNIRYKETIRIKPWITGNLAMADQINIKGNCGENINWQRKQMICSWLHLCKYTKQSSKIPWWAVYKYTKGKLCSKASIRTVKNSDGQYSKSRFESTEIVAEFFENTCSSENTQNLLRSPLPSYVSSYLGTVDKWSDSLMSY